MRRYLFTIASTLLLMIIIVVCGYAQHKNFYLTAYHSRAFVKNHLINDNSWINYPTYYDRDGWNKIPEEVRRKTIAEGEKFLSYIWPRISASMYLEFSRNGNKEVVDKITTASRNAFNSLVLAELMEGKGRFMDDIINGVFDICEKTYWGQSAHFYLYGHDHVAGTINNPFTVLPDIDNPIIDLMTADVSADLAWANFFLHGEFDKISPVISRRIKTEIKRKVLEPYYNRYDFWWIAGWGEGHRIFEQNKWNMNNWTPWITYNMLTSILLIEDDQEKMLNGIMKTMSSIDLFIDSYPNDGACMEGFSYWRRAAGHLFNYLDILKKITNGQINIFDKELIANRGRFVYRAYLGRDEYFISFASSPARVRHNPGLLYRFGRAIDDPLLKGFGVHLMNRFNFWGEAFNVFPGSMYEALEHLFNLEGWDKTEPVEPLLADFYFPDSEIALARDKEGSTDGFCFAAWGNDNGGGHNDNDVGNLILHYNGEPVFIDMRDGSSARHNLPIINGFQQGRGAAYKAKETSFNASKNKVVFVTDIAGAYPPEAAVKQWKRTYILDRKKGFSIEDQYILAESTGTSSLHFFTPAKVEIVQPGIVQLEGEGYKMNMKYNHLLMEARIDMGHSRNNVQRIVFSVRDKRTTAKSVLYLYEI